MIISKADKIQMRSIKMSLVVQWLRVQLPLWEAWFCSLVGELRSYRLTYHVMRPKKKKKRKELCKVVNIRNSQTWLHVKNHLERFHLPVKIKEKNFTLSVKSKEVWI